MTDTSPPAASLTSSIQTSSSSSSSSSTSSSSACVSAPSMTSIVPPSVCSTSASSSSSSPSTSAAATPAAAAAQTSNDNSNSSTSANKSSAASSSASNSASVSPDDSDDFDEERLLLHSDISAGGSCHQCKTARARSHLLVCTRMGNQTRKRRCRKKFCHACLLRSYGVTASNLSKSECAKWLCPSCTGSCICAACNRRQSIGKYGGGTHKEQHVNAIVRPEMYAPYANGRLTSAPPSLDYAYAHSAMGMNVPINSNAHLYSHVPAEYLQHLAAYSADNGALSFPGPYAPGGGSAYSQSLGTQASFVSPNQLPAQASTSAAFNSQSVVLPPQGPLLPNKNSVDASHFESSSNEYSRNFSAPAQFSAFNSYYPTRNPYAAHAPPELDGERNSKQPRIEYASIVNNSGFSSHHLSVPPVAYALPGDSARVSGNSPPSAAVNHTPQLPPAYDLVTPNQSGAIIMSSQSAFQASKPLNGHDKSPQYPPVSHPLTSSYPPALSTLSVGVPISNTVNMSNVANSVPSSLVARPRPVRLASADNSAVANHASNHASAFSTNIQRVKLPTA